MKVEGSKLKVEGEMKNKGVIMRYLRFIVLGLWVLVGCTQVKEKHVFIFFTSPAWSPDGKEIYYIKDIHGTREIQGFFALNSELQWKDVWYLGKCAPDGSDTVTLGKIYEESKWSPDGGMRSFGCVMDVSPYGEIVLDYPPGIWIMDTLGENLSQILSWGSSPHWAFNYTKIIFQGDLDHHPGIWIMDKNGGNLSRIIDYGKVRSSCDANNKLAISNGDSILVYSFETGNIDTLNLKSGWVDWNTSGNKIAWISDASDYVSCEDETLSVCIYDVIGDSLMSCTSIEDMNTEFRDACVYELRWQPNGDYLLLTFTHQDLGIWIIKWDGTELREIISNLQLE